MSQNLKKYLIIEKRDKNTCAKNSNCDADNVQAPPPDTVDSNNDNEPADGDIVIDIENEVPPAPPAQNNAQNVVVPPKRKGEVSGFLPSWKTKFPWLLLTAPKTVVCTICQRDKSNHSNDWATGKAIRGWYTSTFTDHVKFNKDHKHALTLPALQRGFKVAVEVAISKAEYATIGLMINALAAMQDEDSIIKIPFLHKLADTHIERTIHTMTADEVVDVETGASTVAVKRAACLSSSHRSLYSTYKLLQAMNTAQLELETQKLRSAMAICIHVDESTDIANTKLLLIYCTIVSEDPSPDLNGERFGTVLHLSEGCDAASITAAITNWMATSRIDPNRVVMFTSDGAAVMLGRISGVAQRLRNDHNMPHLLEYHCVCHREALAMKDAYKNSPPFTKLETVLKHVISYLATSKNLLGLQNVADVLDLVLHVPHRIYEIRWLSRYQVIGDFVKSMEAILTYLEQKTNDADDYQARPLHTKLSDSRNLVLLHHLYDLLGPVDRLSKQLQKSDLHPFSAMALVKVTITQLRDNYVERSVDNPINGRNFARFLEKVGKKYIRPTGGAITAELQSSCDVVVKALAKEIVEAMEARLWNDHDIIYNMKIFYPSPELPKMTAADFDLYGEGDLALLIDHYEKPLELDHNETFEEWAGFKYTYLRSFATTKDWQIPIRNLVGDEAYPNLGKLAAALLAFNSQNATVERGFSLVNRLRTKIRNRLQTATLDLAMRLRLSTACYDEYDYKPALAIYTQKEVYCLGDLPKRPRTSVDTDDGEDGRGDEVFDAFEEMVEKTGGHSLL